ncbi:MAG: glucuronyl hydrolase [Flavobacteriaceae bacterium]
MNTKPTITPRFLSIICFLLILTSCGNTKKIGQTQDNNTMDFAIKRLETALHDTPNPKRIPRSIKKDGSLKSVGPYDWTSGFFPGSLWYVYELTQGEKWKTKAITRTEVLDTIQYWTGNHDVGFIMNCSYGNGLKFGNQQHYKAVLVQTAESLSKRFNPTAKVLKSWQRFKAWNGQIWRYPVIIDNMMNLELLFEATKLSGNPKYQAIAVQHAQTTMKNHYRNDYSSYHVVNYDTITGNVLAKKTAQGFADESAWARGQAWGLYGYTLCYRYTKDPAFLDFAEHIANYIINNPNLPKDMVPYWDYNAASKLLVPEWKYNAADFPVIPRDASAAAITASALLELSGYSSQKETFKAAAEKIIKSLSSPAYMVKNGKNKYFILDHSVGSIPHGAEIDVPLNYADYYFLEALYRKGRMEQNKTF